MSRGPSGGAVLGEGFLRHLFALSPFAVASHAEKQQPTGFSVSSEATATTPSDVRLPALQKIAAQADVEGRGSMPDLSNALPVRPLEAACSGAEKDKEVGQVLAPIPA